MAPLALSGCLALSACASTNAAAPAAAAGPACGAVAAVDRVLRNNHGEAPVWRGLTGGRLAVLYQAPGGSWTLVTASPAGLACIRDHGRDGQTLQAAAKAGT